jgi:hypothetical protein
MPIFTASTILNPEDTDRVLVKDDLRKRAALEAISRGCTKITDARFETEDAGDEMNPDFKKVTVFLSAERIP